VTEVAISATVMVVINFSMLLTFAVSTPRISGALVMAFRLSLGPYFGFGRLFGAFGNLLIPLVFGSAVVFGSVGTLGSFGRDGTFGRVGTFGRGGSFGMSGIFGIFVGTFGTFGAFGTLGILGIDGILNLDA